MKPCQLCYTGQARYGERYCDTCRKAVVREARKAYDAHELLNVRTLSRAGTEMIGRPALPMVVSDALIEVAD